MLDRRVIRLAREIRDLYARTCALADRYNEAVGAEQRSLTDVFRAPRSEISELNAFENLFDRQEAIQKAMKDPQVRARMMIGQFVCWLIAVGLAFQSLQSPAILSAGLILILVLATAAAWLQHHFILRSEPFRRSLREQLVARGMQLCLHCGYDLRGQVSPRCPECGRAATAAKQPTVPGASYVR